MAYTDPSTLTFAFEEVPSAAKVNSATNEQFLAMFPDDDTGADWDPTWTAVGGGLDVSNDDGASYRVGAIQYVWARATISNAGTGEYYVELPVPAVGIPAGTVLGQVFAQDSSASANNEVGVVVLTTASPQQFRFAFAGGNLGAVHPFAMTTGDALSFQAQYPLA